MKVNTDTCDLKNISKVWFISKKEPVVFSSTAFPTGPDWDITTPWFIFQSAFPPAAVTKQGTVTQFVRNLVAVKLLRGFNMEVYFSCEKRWK